MELIEGFIRRHIFQIMIHTFIVCVSFIFLLISFFLGYELHSFVGVLIIFFAVIFVSLIVTTVFKMQILIDRDVWKSLYKIGILRQEKRKILICIDLIFEIVSVPISLVVGNSLIHRYLFPEKCLWLQDGICIAIEVVIFLIAYWIQNLFVEERYETKRHKSIKLVSENAPLCWKNVKRNHEKVSFSVCIICIGIIACSAILFICNCDDTESYLDKAMSVDYFLTQHDTRSDEFRTEKEVVDETDIKKVQELEMFDEGGCLYHNLNEQRCGLITNDLPENSQFEMFYNYEFEKNEAGNYLVNLYGADDFVFSNMEIYEGEIDYDRLATGDYIIYGLERKPGAIAYQGEIKEEWKYFQVGDKVTIAGSAKTKEYEIMAICIVNHTYAENNSYAYPGNELVFYLPSFEYLNFGQEEPMRYLFNTKGGANVDRELAGIRYESKAGWMKTYLHEEETIKNSSIIFALCCVSVGVFVYINMLIISFLDRRKEFEILEKIGMSSCQMKRMIIGEGAVYGGLIMIISILATILVEIMGDLLMTDESWRFRWDFVPVGISVSVVFVISIVIPMCLYKKVTK